MKVYLAGPSRQLDRVKHWAKKLEEAGHAITYKWWTDVEKHGPGNDGQLCLEDRRKYAAADLEGVAYADVVWVLYNLASQGLAVELGYAIATRDDQSCEKLAHGAAGPLIVVTGETHHNSIFTSLADKCLVFDEEGLEAIEAWSKGSAAP